MVRNEYDRIVSGRLLNALHRITNPQHCYGMTFIFIDKLTSFHNMLQYRHQNVSSKIVSPFQDIETFHVMK